MNSCLRRFFVSLKNNPMNAQATIRFTDNGTERELSGMIKALRRENNEEVLYTSCGNRIFVNHILSFNGIRF